MVLTLAHLPQDVLVIICTHMPVEDVLALIQACRALHALGSFDYLWRTLLSDWDIPLDIPSNASLASLSSNFLRAAAVKSLRLDARWRHPRLGTRHVQRIISQNSSFVDGMRLLPGGRWLVTLQYEQAVKKTHVTLWSTSDVNDHHSVFKTTVSGRVRCLHAHHHHELEQSTIGVVFTRRTADFIRAYNVFLQGNSPATHALLFEAKPNDLYSMGRIAVMKINGEIMLAVFVPESSSQHYAQILCVNLATRVAVSFQCSDWLFTWSRLKMFCRHFAVVSLRDGPTGTFARLSYYELPSLVLDHLDRLSPSVPRWPERSVIEASMISSTSWRSDYPLSEFSDDVHTRDTDACSFTIFEHHFDLHPTALDICLLRVSFDGSIVKCTPSIVPCRAIPSDGQVRLSSSGRRAVWLSSDPESEECTLIKFALGREGGNGSGSSISTLMPSFSGLPFGPLDFHSFVFDEISCKMAVSLPSAPAQVQVIRRGSTQEMVTIAVMNPFLQATKTLVTS